MRKTIGLVLAGGRVEELSVLTERRAKAAVIFGGTYRAIDFALTNLANAGIGHVGILAQYRPSSLMDHVGTGLAWDLAGTTRGVRFLLPYIGMGESGDWYRGPADALSQNLDFIERLAPDDVMLVSGDHVYSMDYRPLLSFHAEHDADLTMAFTERRRDAHRFGVGELNATGQILNFAEKPRQPRSSLASMSVYVFRREVLVEEIRRASRGEEGSATFQIHEVLRRMMPRRRAYGWIFHGVWAYTRTLDEYHAFHREVLGPSPRVDLARWEIRTNVLSRRTAPPPAARIMPGAHVENSLISAGCEIHGTVRNSVLSPNVVVGQNAEVHDSVLWDGVMVEPGAVLQGVISDKRVIFGGGCNVGVGESVPSEEMKGSLEGGSTVIGMDARIPPGLRIGKNVIVCPEVSEGDFSSHVPSGRTVRAAAAAGKPR